MKLQIGDRVLDTKNNKFGTIIDWYEDYDGDDDSGPIYLHLPVIRYDDNTEGIRRSFYVKKVEGGENNEDQ